MVKFDVMEYNKALRIAEEVKKLLSPHCDRIEIAGSIRRQKKQVKDIEIVAIPKPFETGLFESGVAAVVNQWPKVKGELPCKYTQRILPEGIKLDLFFAERGNWGMIMAIRTGSADFSHKVLAKTWVKKGYTSSNGYLIKNDKPVAVLEEKDLFHRLGLEYVLPEFRGE
jgi:DNA polymerase/3'-5' exonuclease PolX